MTTDTNGAGGLPESGSVNEIERAREVSRFLSVMGTQAMDRRGAYGGTHETSTSMLYKDAARFATRHADHLELCRATREGDGEFEFFTAPKDMHPETVNLIARFASALAEKLAEAERKYGWDTHWKSPAWMDQCREQLVEHVAKGDPRDVAAYCAFLWHHGEPTALRTLSRVAVQEGMVLVPMDSAKMVTHVCSEWIDLFRDAPGLDKYERYSYEPAVEELRDEFAAIAAQRKEG